MDDYSRLESPYNVLRENRHLGLHTLFLLDLQPEKKTEDDRKAGEFMTVAQALKILQAMEKKKKEGIVKEDMLAVGCARLGRDDFVIKSGKLKEIKAIDFGKPPHCLIIPGKLHFVEEEMLRLWK